MTELLTRNGRYLWTPLGLASFWIVCRVALSKTPSRPARPTMDLENRALFLRVYINRMWWKMRKSKNVIDPDERRR
jgi:hypothetical protein